MSNNPRPHVFIPHLDAQQPAVPTRPVSSDYTFQVVPPSRPSAMSSASWSPQSSQLSPQRRQPSHMTLPSRPRIQSASDPYPTTSSISFPEPQFYRSISASHQSLPSSNPSVSSFASSYAEDDHYGLGSPEVCSPIPSLSSPLFICRRTTMSPEIQHPDCMYQFCYSSAIVTFFIASFIAWMPEKPCLVFKQETSKRATRNGIS